MKPLDQIQLHCRAFAAEVLRLRKVHPVFHARGIVRAVVSVVI